MGGIAKALLVGVLVGASAQFAVEMSSYAVWRLNQKKEK